MRIALAVVVALSSATAAVAQGAPVIAVPGRAGVPVIINGRDASYAVVEGEWGLGKSIDPRPVIIGAWEATYVKPVGRYFPSSGSLPGYGRLEIEPAAEPEHARAPEPLIRSWSAQSAAPVGPQTVPQDPPPIIVAPQIGVPYPHERRR